jgi:hypothetical protein
MTTECLVRSVKIINEKERWIDIGVAYTNQKGIITVYLSALPLTNKRLLIPAGGT